jgi:hypothetical protein
MAGVLAWHQGTGRYLEPMLYKSPTVGRGLHGLTGLSTSAARIGTPHAASVPEQQVAAQPAKHDLTGLGTSAARIGMARAAGVPEQQVAAPPAKHDLTGLGTSAARIAIALGTGVLDQQA